MADQSHFPKTRLMRLRAIIAPDGPIPVSKSTWWSGVRAGRFPKPLKLGKRITVWRTEDIERLVQSGTSDDGASS